ncbi:hypothetical protein DSM104443_02690 [Usitatibacter rugosus]|uniref:DUF1304 domain-containing protein n=1 Tax=Usitatibacter rugosus TaxID=2732067 RepID=A0A6M4GWD0_9PROT|nr:hypothetical protein [Usitatibacter rugosus]QJR11611.1 hypothetical protein DSM104443_02690 [Usitatibacter rugosus]
MSIVALVALGAGIFAALGTLHLLYTFFTPKFDPRDAAVKDAMQATSPRITRATTMWKAWVGFNASHSLGAMVFGAVYLTLAVQHPEVLAASKPLLLIAGATGLAFLALAVRYWFRIPLIGIALATLCFLVASARAFI